MTKLLKAFNYPDENVFVTPEGEFRVVPEKYAKLFIAIEDESGEYVTYPVVRL